LTGTEEVGDQYWRGYTYVWNDEQTDAVLLEDPQGQDRTFTLRDPKAPGGRRQQTWHFPSRTECTVCHNIASKYVVGVQTPQMNRDHDYGGTVANQLRALEQLGVFTQSLPAAPEEMARLVDYRDPAQDLHLRARAYLHANCAHCHRKWGGGNTEFQLVAPLDLAETGVLNVRPAHGAFNLVNARLLAPGDPYRSVLLYRMATLGPGHMPRLGSNVIDTAGVRLIHDWISRLHGTGMVTDAQMLASARLAVAVNRLRTPNTTPAGERDKLADTLLASPGAALRLVHALGDKAFPAPVRNAVVARAAKLEAAEVRDLFERFLPEEDRVKRLGDVIRPEQILALPGDAGRGRRLFFEVQGVQCRNCHRVGGKGTEIGPDLDQIGKKYERAQILDHILNPSKLVEEKYLTYLVETRQGQVHTGLLVKRDATHVVLRDATNKLIEVAAGDVTLVAPQRQSLMPELLLRDLTAEQVADLTAFLSSLK
jgi:putative heme-binding domain-containing protein